MFQNQERSGARYAQNGQREEGALRSPRRILYESNQVRSDKSPSVAEGVDQRDSHGSCTAAEYHRRQTPERSQKQVAADDDEPEEYDTQYWLRQKRGAGKPDCNQDPAGRRMIEALVVSIRIIIIETTAIAAVTNPVCVFVVFNVSRMTVGAQNV